MTARAVARLLAVFTAVTAGEAVWNAAHGDYSAAGVGAGLAALMLILVVCFALQATAAHTDNVTEVQFRQTLEREAA